MSAFRQHLGQPQEILDAMPLQAIVAEADRVAGAADKAAQHRNTLELKLKGAEDVPLRAKAQADKAREATAEWTRRWAPAVERLGLRPSDPHVSIREALGTIEKMRQKVTKIQGLAKQCTGMEDDLLKFGVFVRALAAKCGVDADGREPGDVLKDLQSMTDEAEKADGRRRHLEGSLKSAEEDIQKARRVTKKPTSWLSCGH
jgi:uncharacterized protein YhaN